MWYVEVVMYWCGISWWSCISVVYRGDHVFICDILVVMYLCVGYRGGHVFVWYVVVVMYLCVISWWSCISV